MLLDQSWFLLVQATADRLPRLEERHPHRRLRDLHPIRNFRDSRPHPDPRAPRPRVGAVGGHRGLRSAATRRSRSSASVTTGISAGSSCPCIHRPPARLPAVSASAPTRRPGYRVVGDPVQPRREFRRPAVAVESTEGADPDFLGQVVSLVRLSRSPRAPSERPNRGALGPRQ